MRLNSDGKIEMKEPRKAKKEHGFLLNITAQCMAGFLWLLPHGLRWAFPFNFKFLIQFHFSFFVCFYFDSFFF
ncbi:uncharacterized protein BDW43DRAFT_292758 [Aspergillus alliaceus]|uniref:uncharacterized protein n=1 Tax=Petromyces alliaceus TaxID=209559 RepID=UPI0012A6C51A|nr:uncharacterized protein BDW43DRAFT_292758 [Aspergillus alliaceus]KAB8227887.1 hypothetical protein BDW43DRAFT_292758 [Aspergillus alliaceus]